VTNFDMELTQRKALEYQKSNKKQKGEILSRYCSLTGATRNLASKRFQKTIRDFKPRVLQTHPPKESRATRARRGGRRPKYVGLHKGIIKAAWELSGEICGERLHPVLSEYINHLEESGALKGCGSQYVREAKTISERTLKRIIAEFPKEGSKHHQGNAEIYKAIPINAHFGRNANQPGYVEIDYVEHNGGNSSGCFANTGCYVDVCLGWIARFSALGKSEEAVALIHRQTAKRIYHKVYEYHPDNAKPILKLLLEKQLHNGQEQYSISRSRPYHKEDNGHVEQKNGDKIRKLVGYHRYDTKEQVTLLNRLYEVEDTISNFFIPSQKLEGKVTDSKGRVVARRHEKAQTAYQRLISSSKVDKEVKKEVFKLYRSLNLIKLRGQSDELQKRLYQTVVSRKNIMA